jgi:putative flippase GtrA
MTASTMSEAEPPLASPGSVGPAVRSADPTEPAATTPAPIAAAAPVTEAAPYDVELVIPVYNEQVALEPAVRRLHEYASSQLPYSFRITIADNASMDDTWQIAGQLSRELPGVQAVHLDQKGRGRALGTVWMASKARVVAYMDVDLSTDLAALLPLLASLMSGHSDVAVGNRLAPSSRIIRGAKREFVSRSYNLLLRTVLRTRFSDAQCGFKAIRTDAAQQLLPLVQNTSWFFDTELLILAERAGLRIHEVPVDWIDDPDSRVDIKATVIEDLRGVARMTKALSTGALPVAELRRQFGRGALPSPLPGVPLTLPRQLVRFVAVGVASTLAYLLLFVLLRPEVGAQGANILSLLITAIANTAVNRRLTFGVKGSHKAARTQAEGLLVLGIGVALTSGALAALNAWQDNPSRTAELTVLVTANLAATLVRFLLFRAWIFHPRRQPPAPETASANHHPASLHAGSAEPLPEPTL